MAKILAIANQKGGVGKTTTSINLAASLAKTRRRVLLVDIDPQGNATMGSGIPKDAAHPTTYDILIGGAGLESARKEVEAGYSVIPANAHLSGAEIELISVERREHRLREALQAGVDRYDFVLIDCPPSLGLITLNALTAATEVMVPIQCEYYALEGVSQLTRNVELVRANLNPTLYVGTIVLTMYDARTKLADSVVSEVRSHFGDIVCKNVIPRTVRISEAPSFGEPITVHDPTSRGAIAYRELAKEVSSVPS